MDCQLTTSTGVRDRVISSPTPTPHCPLRVFHAQPPLVHARRCPLPLPPSSTLTGPDLPPTCPPASYPLSSVRSRSPSMTHTHPSWSVFHPIPLPYLFPVLIHTYRCPLARPDPRTGPRRDPTELRADRHGSTPLAYASHTSSPRARIPPYPAAAAAAFRIITHLRTSTCSQGPPPPHFGPPAHQVSVPIQVLLLHTPAIPLSLIYAPPTTTGTLSPEETPYKIVGDELQPDARQCQRVNGRV